MPPSNNRHSCRQSHSDEIKSIQFLFLPSFSETRIWPGQLDSMLLLVAGICNCYIIMCGSSLFVCVWNFNIYLDPVHGGGVGASIATRYSMYCQ